MQYIVYTVFVGFEVCLNTFHTSCHSRPASHFRGDTVTKMFAALLKLLIHYLTHAEVFRKLSDDKLSDEANTDETSFKV